MIAALKKPESEHDYKQGLMKASEKLGIAFPEADIRLLVDGLLQKNSLDLYAAMIFPACLILHSKI